MVLQLSEKLSIENLRNYPSETVDNLRVLLENGALAHADPRHENFYEVENGRRVFYVYLSPASGKVILLATWRRDQ